MPHTDRFELSASAKQALASSPAVGPGYSAQREAGPCGHSSFDAALELGPDTGGQAQGLAVRQGEMVQAPEGEPPVAKAQQHDLGAPGGSQQGQLPPLLACAGKSPCLMQLCCGGERSLEVAGPGVKQARLAQLMPAVEDACPDQAG